MAAAVVAVVGCATHPLNVPAPSQSVLNSRSGDYKAFVQDWMAALPHAPNKNASPALPSDARLLVVQIDDIDREYKGLVQTFQTWCEASQGTMQRRGEDLVRPGPPMLVCETKANASKIAVLNVVADPPATNQTSTKVLIRHWYPPDIDPYMQEMQRRSDRRASQWAQAEAERVARKERDERAEEEAQIKAVEERKARDRGWLATFAAASSEFRTTPTCQRFERESNALRARLTGSMTREALARYLSDLIVTLDECAHAKVAPPASLSVIYQANLQGFQFFAAVWDANLAGCESGNCRSSGRPASANDQRRMAELQRSFRVIPFSPPERVEDILEHTQRFVLDR